MKYDIVFSFITPVGRVSGFMTAEPIPNETLSSITEARDQIQKMANDLNQLTLFSREPGPLLEAASQNPTAHEVTLPGELIKNSIMLSQIVEVAE